MAGAQGEGREEEQKAMASLNPAPSTSREAPEKPGRKCRCPPERPERRRCRGERCLPRDEPGRSAADAGLLSGCCGRGAGLNRTPAGRDPPAPRGDRAAAGAAAAPGRPGPGGRPGGAAQPGTPGAQDEAKSGNNRGGCAGGARRLRRGEAARTWNGR